MLRYAHSVFVAGGRRTSPLISPAAKGTVTFFGELLRGDLTDSLESANYNFDRE